MVKDRFAFGDKDRFNVSTFDSTSEAPSERLLGVRADTL